MTRRTAFSSRLAVLAMVSVCGFPVVAGAAGGTITFRGAIVESASGFQTGPSAASSFTRATSMAGIDVTFPGGNRTSATVRADGLDQTPLVVSAFGVTATAAGNWHLGPQGGSLSIHAKSSRADGGAPGAILTVAYD